MSDSNVTNDATSAGGWMPVQAYVIAVVCLLLGVAVGYMVRGARATATPDKAVDAGTSSQTSGQMSGAPGSGTSQQVTPEQLKHMADKQAEPLQQQLSANPNSPELLANIGNVYYDARQYNDAISYYDRALKLQPANTDVRTDTATAYWYLGDSDRAIAEFQAVLKLEPTKANALYNLGIVQWQGKMDANGAAATLQRLLDTNPNYANKAQVQELLAQVKKHSDIQPDRKTE